MHGASTAWARSTKRGGWSRPIRFGRRRSNQQAADQGEAFAQTSLGYYYETGTGVEVDIDRAVGLYQSAAEKGHAQAQHNLAVLYEEGRGVAQDFTRAFELYTQAANGGNMDAAVNLGMMYLNGSGTPADEAEAVRWTQAAARRTMPWGSTIWATCTSTVSG